MDELKSTAQKILIMKPAGLRDLGSSSKNCVAIAMLPTPLVYSRTRNDAMPQECVHAKSKLRTTYTMRSTMAFNPAAASGFHNAKRMRFS